MFVAFVTLAIKRTGTAGETFIASLISKTNLWKLARFEEYTTSTDYSTSVYTETVPYSLADFQRWLSKACGTNYA